MYTITGIVLLIGVIVGHTQAYRRARDPSTLGDQPKKIIKLPRGSFYGMNVNDNGAIFAIGGGSMEIYDRQGNHVNTIQCSAPYERYERYGSVVTKDQLLILETFHTPAQWPPVTSVNEYTFTGQLIGTKFTVDTSQVPVNTGRLGISGGKIIVNGPFIILINEDGSNPHRLEYPNMGHMGPFYAHPERGVYIVERGYDPKIVIYDAASETVKDTITVSDVISSPNKIFVDDDGRIYYITESRIYILDASGNLLKEMNYGSVADIDIGPDGTLYILGEFTHVISLY